MLITLKPCDQVPYFYISFDSQEAIECCNNFKILKFSKFLKFPKNQNFTNVLTLFVLEDYLRNECVPYHKTKTAIIFYHNCIVFRSRSYSVFDGFGFDSGSDKTVSTPAAPVPAPHLCLSA